MNKIKNLLTTKKAKIFAGVIIVGVIGVVMATTVAQAQFKGLIKFFAQITTTSNVNQSIKVDDHVYGAGAAWTYTANNVAGGETVFNGPHFIRNTASVPIKVTLETDPNPDNLNPSVVERVWHNVQITTGGKYKRDPNFLKTSDGRYWIFFAQSSREYPNNPNSPGDYGTYQIYYTVSLDKGETWSIPIALPRVSGIHAFDVAAIQDNTGKIWVFVSDSRRTKQIYYYTSDDNGLTWNGPTAYGSVVGRHVHAIYTKGGTIAVFFDRGDGIYVDYKKSGAGWSGAKKIVDYTGAALPKAMQDSSGKVRVVWTIPSQGIYMSIMGSDWDEWTHIGPIAQSELGTLWDPYLYQDSDGKYWLAYAVWDEGGSGSTWIEYRTSNDCINWSQPKILVKFNDGRRSFWPVIAENENHDRMIIYGSDNNWHSNTSKRDGQIWIAKTGTYWATNRSMKITVPANSWIGVIVSNVFKDNTGASTYRTVTTVKK